MSKSHFFTSLPAKFFNIGVQVWKSALNTKLLHGLQKKGVADNTSQNTLQKKANTAAVQKQILTIYKFLNECIQKHETLPAGTGQQ